MDAISIQTINNIDQNKLNSPKLSKFQKSKDENEEGPTLMVIDLSKPSGEKASIAIGSNFPVQNISSSQKESKNTQPLTPKKGNRQSIEMRDSDSNQISQKP